MGLGLTGTFGAFGAVVCLDTGRLISVHGIKCREHAVHEGMINSALPQAMEFVVASSFCMARASMIAWLCLQMQVSSNGKGLGGAWHLSHIEVVNTGTGEKLVFPFNGWLDKKHGLEHMLYPDRDGNGVPEASITGTIDYEVRPSALPAVLWS